MTGVDDDVANAGGHREATVSHTVSGGDYAGVTASDVTVTVTDDDTRSVVISESSAEVSEAGGTATYEVKLSTEPTGSVTVIVASSDESSATVAPDTLTFDATTWGTAQEVTVTGVDDDVANAGGHREATVSHTVSGGDYAGVTASDVTVTVTDDDTRSVVISESSAEVSEAGGTATYEVKLSTEPTGSVTVIVASSDESSATVAPDTLTFDATTWGTAQEVTVTGVDDDVVNAGGHREATVSHTVSGGDYAGVTASDVTVTVTDDDTRSVVISESSAEVSEAGGTATYEVKLSTEPTGSVTVIVASSDESSATVAPDTLTFDATTWGTAQEVTVTGVDDDVANAGGHREATVSHTVSGGDYAGVTASDVTVTVTDDGDDHTPVTQPTSITLSVSRR